MQKNRHTLMNPWLKITVRPDLGGRIDSFIDQETQREWVWHPPEHKVEPSRSLPQGASFDENWTGGWDDIFPSDAPDPFQGQAMYDHGEVWSQAWRVLESSSQGITMRVDCESLPLTLEKTIVMDPETPTCRFTHKIYNRSEKQQAFLFKQHPAIAIDEGDELIMPACDLQPVDLDFSRIAGLAETTRYPYVLDAMGELTPIDHMLAKNSQKREFLYAKNLEGGFCGIRNHASQTELLFTFDPRQFPYVWIFTSFSGFRDHYVLILEPCTNIPFDLETAFRQKTCGLIGPRATLHYETQVQIQKTVSRE